MIYSDLVLLFLFLCGIDEHTHMQTDTDRCGPPETQLPDFEKVWQEFLVYAKDLTLWVAIFVVFCYVLQCQSIKLGLTQWGNMLYQQVGCLLLIWNLTMKARLTWSNFSDSCCVCIS